MTSAILLYGMIHQITCSSFHFKKLSAKSGGKAGTRQSMTGLESTRNCYRPSYACQGSLLF